MLISRYVIRKCCRNSIIYSRTLYAILRTRNINWLNFCSSGFRRERGAFENVIDERTLPFRFLMKVFENRNAKGGRMYDMQMKLL